MIKFSIILPVKNGGDYVKECVRSILNQSYPYFDLHILENCSSDGTTEWLKGLSDDRVKLIETPVPLTIEQNWSRITQIQKNEFITLIGHDDILFPDYLQVMNDLINRHPGGGLYQSHFHFIDANGQKIRNCLKMDDYYSSENFLNAILCGKIDIMGTGFMMKSEYYDSIGGIPDYPNLLFADFEMVIELAKKGGFYVSSDSMFAFRLHQSTTKSSSDSKIQSGFERFLSYLIKLKKEDGTYDDTIKECSGEFIHNYCKGLSHRLLRTSYKQRNGLSVKDFIRKCALLAKQLTNANTFDPLKDKSIRLALFIDSNPITRFLFLTFKRFYPKPILK